MRWRKHSGTPQPERAEDPGQQERVGRVEQRAEDVEGKGPGPEGTIEDLPAGGDVTALITSIWQENLFSCLKRSTLGSYALGVLDAEWSDYARFHLETANCDFCAAHLHDVQKGGQEISPQARERILMTSAGFLR